VTKLYELEGMRVAKEGLLSNSIAMTKPGGSSSRPQ
jgi:hypothetical protein